MNYQKIYNNLITLRKQLNRKKREGIYYEWHHIKPKCFGGSNEKNNLILLTFREHWFAHKLLVEIHNGKEKRSMIQALWRMMLCKNGQRIISSHEYDKTKKLMIENRISTGWKKGNIPWNKNKKMSKNFLEKVAKTKNHNFLLKKSNKSLSKFKGVYKNGENYFQARIKVNGKRMYLGTGTEIECAKLYNDAVLKYYNGSVLLNEI